MSERTIKNQGQEVDWTRYAHVYDLILKYNEAYQKIIEEFVRVQARWQMPEGAQVLDVGSGTGNFGLELAARRPSSAVVLLDRDPGMLDVAREKAQSRKIRNVEFIEADVGQIDAVLSGREFDAFIAVHSMYTLSEAGANKAIHSLRQMMKPTANGFVCDLGRVLNIGDWAAWLFGSVRRRYGLATALSVFWRGRDIASENRRIRKLQLEGVYWTHSLSDFTRWVTAGGFEVIEAGSAFRDYSDFVDVRVSHAEAVR